MTVTGKSLNEEYADKRRDEFHNSIAYHKVEPQDTHVTRDFKTLRNAAHVFGDVILDTTKSSREQSLALTHVEEALMWATKQVAVSRLPVAE